MSNEPKFLLLALLYFAAVVFIYKFIGKSGMYVFSIFSTLAMNVSGCRMISLFGIPTGVGLIFYAATYLCTDILSENHGKDEAQKAVKYSFIAMMLWALTSQAVLWFTPHPKDFFGEGLTKILTLSPRLLVSSTIAFVVSQKFDVFMYHFIWKKTGNNKKMLWLRNNIGTLSSQVLDTSVHIFLLYTGIYSLSIMLSLIATKCIFKILLAFLDTPFIYLARFLKNRDKKEEENADCKVAVA